MAVVAHGWLTFKGSFWELKLAWMGQALSHSGNSTPFESPLSKSLVTKHGLEASQDFIQRVKAPRKGGREGGRRKGRKIKKRDRGREGGTEGEKKKGRKEGWKNKMRRREGRKRKEGREGGEKEGRRKGGRKEKGGREERRRRKEDEKEGKRDGGGRRERRRKKKRKKNKKRRMEGRKGRKMKRKKGRREKGREGRREERDENKRKEEKCIFPTLKLDLEETSAKNPPSKSTKKGLLINLVSPRSSREPLQRPLKPGDHPNLARLSSSNISFQPKLFPSQIHFPNPAFPLTWLAGRSQKGIMATIVSTSPFAKPLTLDHVTLRDASATVVSVGKKMLLSGAPFPCAGESSRQFQPQEASIRLILSKLEVLQSHHWASEALLVVISVFCILRAAVKAVPRIPQSQHWEFWDLKPTSLQAGWLGNYGSGSPPLFKHPDWGILGVEHVGWGFWEWKTSLFKHPDWGILGAEVHPSSSRLTGGFWEWKSTPLQACWLGILGMEVLTLQACWLWILGVEVHLS
ncbi:Octapeptide-repeat protein T2, partial [Ophiophagus hannah]